MSEIPPTPDTPPPLSTRKRKGRGTLLLICFCTVVGGLLVTAVATKAIRLVRVTTPAMEPTLAAEDFVLVGYKRDLVEEDREKIVVFVTPRSNIPGAQTIMRPAALPGDTLSTDGRHLLINGRPRAPMPNMPTRLTPVDLSQPRVVPEGHFFALGDNPENSWDSRYFGYVPFSSVRGFSFSQPVRQEKP